MTRELPGPSDGAVFLRERSKGSTSEPLSSAGGDVRGLSREWQRPVCAQVVFPAVERRSRKTSRNFERHLGKRAGRVADRAAKSASHMGLIRKADRRGGVGELSTGQDQLAGAAHAHEIVIGMIGPAGPNRTCPAPCRSAWYLASTEAAER